MIMQASRLKNNFLISQRNHMLWVLKTTSTRAAVDGTPSQIPAFFTYNLYLGVKVTKNVAQYLLHNVTYASVKFEDDMSNG